MWVFAYGEFDSITFWGAFFETLPFFLRHLLLGVLVYGMASSIVEFSRFRWIGLMVYIVSFLLITPSLAVTGAYGPAHVGMEVGVWVWPSFALVLIVKTIALYSSSSRRRAVDGVCEPG